MAWHGRRGSEQRSNNAWSLLKYGPRQLMKSSLSRRSSHHDSGMCSATCGEMRTLSLLVSWLGARSGACGLGSRGRHPLRAKVVAVLLLVVHRARRHVARRARRHAGFLLLPPLRPGAKVLKRRAERVEALQREGVLVSAFL